MKHTIKLLTLAFMLATILTLTGCPGPVNTVDVWDDGVVTIEPTCTTEGVKTYTCSNGETRTETIPALGHDFDDWKTTKKPTCTEKGSKKHTCTRCGEEETDDIDALGHDWEEITTDETRVATCTEDGLAVYKCKTCGAIEKRTTNKLGHNFEGGYCERRGCGHYEFENHFTVKVFTSEDEFIEDIPSNNVLRLFMNNENNPYDECKFSFESANPSMTLDTLIHKKLRYLNYSVIEYRKIDTGNNIITMVEYEEDINDIYSIYIEPTN